MAIAPTVLAAGISTTDATSYTTASAALASHQNELVTIAVLSTMATGLSPNQPTFTTARGGTWTLVVSRLVSTDSVTNARLTIFRSSSASFTTGTLVIDFAGQTQTLCAWEVVSWTGTRATAANNGSDGIGVSGSTGSASNATNTPLVTLAALSTGSATYAATAHASNQVASPGAGYTELTDVAAATPAFGLETNWKLAGTTTPSSSWVTSSHPEIVAACEILQAFALAGGVSVPAPSLAATTRLAFKESGGVTVPAAALSATAREDFKASIGQIAPAAALAGTVTEAFKVGGGVSVPAASLAATVRTAFKAAGGITAAAASLAATVAEEFKIQGGVVAPAPSLAGTLKSGFALNVGVAAAAPVLGSDLTERFIAIGSEPAAAASLSATIVNTAPGDFTITADVVAPPASLAASLTNTAPAAYSISVGMVAPAPSLAAEIVTGPHVKVVGGGSWEPKSRIRLEAGIVCPPAAISATLRVGPDPILADDEEVLMAL